MEIKYMETLILMFKLAIILTIIAFASGFLCAAIYCRKKNVNCYCCKFATILTNIFFLGLFFGTMFLISSGAILAIALVFLMF